MRRWRPALVAAALLAWAGAAGAHPLAPSLLELRENADGRVNVKFKTPAHAAPGVALTPLLPERCTPLSPLRSEREPDSVTGRFAVDCGPQGLVGQRVGVSGLDESRTDAFLRIELADGRRMQAVLRAGAPEYTVPEEPSTLGVVRDYATLGTLHIATGLDHLLFVFGLLLLVGGELRGVVKTVTAFTVGHSVTLSLAVLGFVSFPVGLIELAIALSVFLLAAELAHGAEAKPGRLRRSPWIMAGAFGLLHGLGFAGALAQVGLPEGEIPLALLSFNVGIELGQLAFVLLALVAGRALIALPVTLPGWARALPVYGLGTLAAYWCFERAAALLS